MVHIKNTTSLLLAGIIGFVFGIVLVIIIFLLLNYLIGPYLTSMLVFFYAIPTVVLTTIAVILFDKSRLNKLQQNKKHN